MRYYKILPKDLICLDFQYHEGLNVDKHKIDDKEYGYGLSFSDADHVVGFCYLPDCFIIAEVEIPDDAIVYHFDGHSKADKIIMKNLRPFWSVDTIEALIREGVPIKLHMNDILCAATKKGYLEAVEYLVGQGADIHWKNEEPICSACYGGHLEVVKFLVGQGADIHSRLDLPICLASKGGYLEVVKFLMGQGADIHSRQDWSICLASEGGYLEVVKFLVEQGADVNKAWVYVTWAVDPVPLDVEDYLAECFWERYCHD